MGLQVVTRFEFDDEEIDGASAWLIYQRFKQKQNTENIRNLYVRTPKDTFKVVEAGEGTETDPCTVYIEKINIEDLN